jgi:hypothetical protein
MMRGSVWLRAAFVAGVGLAVIGFLRLNNARMIAPLRARLEHELDSSRRAGHPVSLLILDADEVKLRAEATALEQFSGQTVLGLSRKSVIVVLNDADRHLADDAELTRAAHRQMDPFFVYDDLDGAAAVLVRLYTSRLIAQGILPALPPLTPLLYPDVEKRPITPAESALPGLGIVLLIYVTGRALEKAGPNQQPTTVNQSPTTNEHC